MLGNIDFGEGVVRKYIDLLFDEDSSLADIIDDLKEDLIQIEYDDGYIIDVGWYPEFDPMGNFKLVLIKDYDWENALFYTEFNTVEALNSNLRQCIQMVKTMSDK